MGIPNEEQVEAAFGELAASAAVMADPADPAVLRTRVRRRRAARAGVAGIAALAVLTTSGWMIQASMGQEHPAPADETTAAATSPAPTTSPAAEETTTAAATDEHTAEEDPVPPGFDDLMGAALTLPSFTPGASNLEEYCPVEPAALTADGPIHLLKVVHARLRADGPVEAVALVGCRPGEAMIRQAVVVADDGEGGYEVTEQLMLSTESDGSIYDIAPDADYGVLLGVLESEPCCSTDPDTLDRWIVRARTGHPLEEVGGVGSAVTDLATAIEVTPAGEGAWEVAVTVRNDGDATSAPFTLGLCGSESLTLDGAAVEHCADGLTEAVVPEGLEPGETYETTLHVQVAPEAEWSRDEAGYGVSLTVSADMVQYGIDALVWDTKQANDRQEHLFTAEDLA